MGDSSTPRSPGSRPARLAALIVAILVAALAFALSWRQGNVRQEKRLLDLVGALGKRTQGGAPEVSPKDFDPFGKHAGPALVAVLHSADANKLAKQQALEALGRLHDPSVFPLLKEWAQSDEPAYRRSAIRGLGALGTPEAIQHLLALFNEPKTREPAIAALGLAHAEEARKPLLQLVTGFLQGKKASPQESLEAVNAAAEALGHIGGEGVKPALMRLLKKPETRLSAAIGLAWLSDRKGFDLLLNEFVGSDDATENQRTLEVLSSVGPAVHPSIAAALRRRLPPLRLRTIITLAGQLKVPSAVEPLTAILTDQRRPMALRERAAAALGEIGDTEAFQALLTAIPSTPEPLRRSLQFGLVKVQCPGADEVLRKTLKDSNPANRETAARLLGLRGVKKAIPDLITALSDSDAGARLNAVQALSTLNAVSAVSALEKLTSDPNPDVRRKARTAVARLKASTR